VLTKILAAHINDVADKHGRAWKMQSTMMALVRQIGCAPKTFNRMTCAVMLGLAALATTAPPASAFIPGTSALQQQLRQNSAVTEVVVVRRGGAARRTTVVGPRGGVARRTTVVGPRGGAARRTTVVGPRGGVARAGGWVRPSRYFWPAGGAIAAGAAIGFVTAATAVAWAGAPPAPGYCWYYTDPGRTQGFWDVCPQ
jgi:hypothetical protein